MPAVKRARDFINRERLYILMLSFILLFNAWSIFSGETFAVKKGCIWGKNARLAAAEKDGKAAQPSSPRLVDRYPRFGGEHWTVEKGKEHIYIIIAFLGMIFTAAFLLGLLLDARILLARLAGKKIFKKSAGHLRVRWKVRDIFKLVIIFLFFGYILHLVEMGLFFCLLSSKMRVDITNLGTFVSIVNTAVMDLAVLGVIIYFVRIKYRQRLAAIGLKMKDAGKHLYWAVLSYIAVLPPLVFILLFLMWICHIFDYQPPPQPLIDLFMEEKNIWPLVFSAFIIMLIGPLAEELFFRGFAYNAIKKKWGAKRAMAVTAVVFAALHGIGFGFLPIMALGFLLAYSYEQAGSLVPAVAIHILHNSIMVLLLLLGRALVV